MFKSWTNRWDELAVFIDTGAAYLAYILAAHVYLYLMHPEIATAQLVSLYFSFSFVVIVVSWLALKLNFKGYSRRWNQLPAEMGMLLAVNIEVGVALSVLIFGFKATWFSRTIFLLFPVMAFVMQTFVHSVIKIGVGRSRKSGYDLRQLAVLGHPSRVGVFNDTVATVPEAGMRVVWSRAIPLGEQELARNALADLREAMRESVIDSVVLVLPIADEVMLDVVAAARRQGKEVRMVLDEVGAIARHSRLYDFYGNSVLEVDASAGRESAHRVFKRVLDVVGAAVGLVVTSPVILLAMAAIKLSDPNSPVFFVQQRVGLNGRTFPFLKFRTMVPNAESLKEQLSHMNVMSGPVFKIPNDPRVTPVGRLLRRTSLDELPQLINVLWGHMSLVGPRPALPSEVRQYGEDYRKRLSVRPGLTCLWQISGRNNIDFQEWMRLDMEYIDGWSLGLDMKIIAKTIPAVIQQRGAH